MRARWMWLAAIALAGCQEQRFPDYGLGPGQRCAELCTAWQSCAGKSVSASCAANCSGRLTRFSEAAGAKFAQCMASSCNADEDACVLSLPLLPEHLRYAEECQRKLTACGDTRIESTCDIEHNAWAARHRLFDATTMTDALACLQRPCSDTCLVALPAYPILRPE
jgi:hypothetical protein